MKLIRTKITPYGILGRIYNDNGVPLAYTLEHAFEQADGSWHPKVAEGTYNCVLGQHQLASMTHPFQTYMLENVPNFMDKPVTEILLHMGNFDKDSEGCILLGDSVINQANGQPMITNSVHTFNDFIAALNGEPSFTLVISQVL